MKPILQEIIYIHECLIDTMLLTNLKSKNFPAIGSWVLLLIIITNDQLTVILLHDIIINYVNVLMVPQSNILIINRLKVVTPYSNIT